MAQFVPDAVLFPFLQRQTTDVVQRNLAIQKGGLAGSGRLGGQLGEQDLQTELTRTFRDQAGVLESPEFQLARDVALQESGIDPTTTARGESVISFGGESFTARGASEGFEGDIGELAEQTKRFFASGGGQFSAVERGISRSFDPAGQQLFSQVTQLTGAQREQLSEQSGIESSQLVQAERFLLQDQSRLGSRVTGQQRTGSQTDQIIRDTIGQRQASSGLFLSQASAAAEASALAATSTARQRQVTPTLLAGTLDPQQLRESGAVSLAGGGGLKGTASQAEAGREFERFAPALAEALGRGEQGPSSRDILGSRTANTRGQISFEQNPLQNIFNPLDPIFGTFGSGSLLGAQ